MEIRFVQICAAGNVLYGLDSSGRVWMQKIGTGDPWKEVYMIVSTPITP